MLRWSRYAFHHVRPSELRNARACGVRREAPAEVVLNARVEMRAQLVGELTSRRDLPNIPAAREIQRRMGHASGKENFARIACVCSHSLASFVSCFLPARVSW